MDTISDTFVATPRVPEGACPVCLAEVGIDALAMCTVCCKRMCAKCTRTAELDYVDHTRQESVCLTCEQECLTAAFRDQQLAQQEFEREYGTDTLKPCSTCDKFTCVCAAAVGE